MVIEPMTFQQLRTKLTALGFRQFRISATANGKPGWLFEKNDPPNASFYLPNYKDEDMVELFDLSAVLMTLKSRGLIEEPNLSLG